ncbi:MAG: hypothetical protein MR912_10015 [Prevotella sp.]|nr:hypothetical protein [Prevotella sp.]
METSILDSIKKLLGIPSEVTEFDTDILIHINSVFSILTQLGVGPSSGFSIEDSSAEWSDFIGDDARLSDVKSFVYLKTRLLFDPPASSAAMDAMNRMASELEWRINVSVDPKEA